MTLLQQKTPNVTYNKCQKVEIINNVAIIYPLNIVSFSAYILLIIDVTVFVVTCDMTELHIYDMYNFVMASPCSTTL